MMYWGGVENKMTYGQGGGHVFRQVLVVGGGGSDVFHWSFFSLKVIASGGLCPPDPPISYLFIRHTPSTEYYVPGPAL